MNYSIPVKTRLSKKDLDALNQENKYILNNIMDQQIIISQLSKGGITFSDTENMDAYERTYIFNKLIKLKQEENKAKADAIKNMKP